MTSNMLHAWFCFVVIKKMNSSILLFANDKVNKVLVCGAKITSLVQHLDLNQLVH